MNSCVFNGNVGRDSELNVVSGSDVLNFPLAVNTGTKSAPQTMWVECAIWGKRATSLVDWIKKGSKICVSGSLGESVYKRKDGSEGRSLRLHVEQLTFTGNAPDKKETSNTNPQTVMPETGDDDIPF